MKLLVIDSNSVLNRAFYGIKLLTTKDGQYTNGIYGFLNILLKIIDEVQPDAIACAFDVKHPTFRHEMYDGYKAQRKGMPEELAQQLPVLKELLTDLGYPIVELPGFEEDVPGKEVLTGFGRETLLGAAPAVLDAVAQGKLRHIFLVGGCDGARPGRNYYTELVEKIPADCLILTLACGKFRFFDKELGSLGGIPRLLDVGQCNDAYAAVRVAMALADALKCGVNDLPLSLVLSWYEQKAVSILLTLLALGVKNIRLGPTLPAFVSPNILKVLVEQWNIMPVTTPDEDLKAILG